MSEVPEVSSADVRAMQPLVSVLMITYAHADTLAQAVESVAFQETGFPFEIIVSEDCSPDNTREVAKALQQRFPDKIRLLLPPRNLGMGNNFALTLKAARAPFIAICEGDDWWTDTGKLARQAAALQQFPEVDLAVSNGTVVLPDGTAIEVPHWNVGSEPRIIPAAELLGGAALQFPTASLFWRASATRPWPSWVADAPFGDLQLIMAGSRRGGAWYDPAKAIAYRSGYGDGFSSRFLNATPLSRAEYAAKAIETLERSVREFDVPRAHVARRIDDFRLMEAKNLLAARRWSKGIRTLLRLPPRMFVQAASRRLRRVSS